jgi:hypothetical protein
MSEIFNEISSLIILMIVAPLYKDKVVKFCEFNPWAAKVSINNLAEK